MVHNSLSSININGKCLLTRRYMYISSLRCCWDQAWKYMVSATLQLTNMYKRKLKNKSNKQTIDHKYFGVGGWERRRIQMLFQAIANSNWGSAAPEDPLPGIFKLIGRYEKDAVCKKRVLCAATWLVCDAMLSPYKGISQANRKIL